MKQREPDEVRAWLDQKPSLAELREAYPADWEAVQQELRGVTARGDLDALKAYAQSVARAPSAPTGRRAKRTSDALSAEIRRSMAVLALRNLSLSAATGIKKGRVRFNLVNGWVAQKLLFERDLRRKPVSLVWFTLLWPLLSQRRFLMPLVEPKGIYCFYSRRLIKELAALVGDRSCLEIAAGDGTLSRFLADAGVAVTATDDYSWEHSVEYPDAVLRQDAREALRSHVPEAVICSWPPPGNPFERFVFEASSVELYIVIASSHAFASGNWDAYERQREFTFTEEPALSRLVLPPELEPAVYVFRRRAAP